MRTIKFRAWDKKIKEMHKWDFKVQKYDNVFWSMVKDEEMPLMQFTGLHDKNGKEIYEGDIIEYNQQWWTRGEGKHKEVVSFNGDASYAHFAAGDWKVGPEETEVIGNIYENLELLK